MMPMPPIAKRLKVRRSVRSFMFVEPSQLDPVAAIYSRGADWESPTSLSFAQTEIRAEDHIAVATFENERVHTAEDVIAGLWQVHQKTRDAMRRSGRVVDADEEIGVRFGWDFPRDYTVMEMRVKTWPAVPGVTTDGPWDRS